MKYRQHYFNTSHIGHKFMCDKAFEFEFVSVKCKYIIV